MSLIRCKSIIQFWLCLAFVFCFLYFVFYCVCYLWSLYSFSLLFPFTHPSNHSCPSLSLILLEIFFPTITSSAAHWSSLAKIAGSSPDMYSEMTVLTRIHI